jgi:hypothetical protein
VGRWHGKLKIVRQMYNISLSETERRTLLE